MQNLIRFGLLWLSATLALWIVDALFDGLRFDAADRLVLAGLVLALVNVTIKPLLILITLPISILSFGLAIPLINGAVLLGIAALVPGFHVDGFWVGVLAALVVSLVSLLINVATGQTQMQGRVHRGIHVMGVYPGRRGDGPPPEAGPPGDPNVIDVEAKEKDR